MSGPVIEANGLIRRRGGRAVVNQASMILEAGEAVALMGPSGCGKTSLLHLLGLLDRPDGGTIRIAGTDPWRGGARSRSALRLGHIGFVFQQSNLLPFLSARDNIAIAAWRFSGDRRAALAESDALLARLGLQGRAGTPGGVLSLGEAQRVAVARALVNRPSLILADEPTGSLDSASMEEVLASFDEVVGQGTALLVATHDPRVGQRMNRTIRMHDGKVDPPDRAELSASAAASRKSCGEVGAPAD